MKAGAANERIGRRAGLSISTVRGSAGPAWQKEQFLKPESGVVVAPKPEPAAETTPDRMLFDASPSAGSLAAAKPADDDGDTATQTEVAVMSAEERSSFDEGEDVAEEIRVQHSTAVRGGAQVQHAGTWLMSSMAERMGLFEGAQSVGETWSGAPRGDALRIAVEATITALAIGERCIEGVRRLGTPTAPLLLRCRHAPSAS